MKISAKTKDHPEPIEVEFDLPEDAEGLVAKYGLDLVADKARGALVIDIQAIMRRHIDNGADAAAIQDAVSQWVPGVRGPVTKQTPFQRASNALGSLSDEEKAELLRKLQGG